MKKHSYSGGIDPPTPLGRTAATRVYTLPSDCVKLGLSVASSNFFYQSGAFLDMEYLNKTYSLEKAGSYGGFS
jgi:hypothetical protein